MILKANLAACFLFFLAVVGIVSLLGDGHWPSVEDAVWPLAFTSPIVIWSVGAWILRGRHRASIVWLAASIVLMLVGLLGIYTDVDAMRREAGGEETMHLAAFLAMLLQWFLAAALLTVIGAVHFFTRISGTPRPRQFRGALGCFKRD